MERFCCQPRSTPGGRLVFVAASGIALLFALVVANTARAQITTQALIGDAVSEVGTRYSNVDEAIKRFANRDFLGARQFLEAAKQKDPSLPPTDLILAKMYFLANNSAAGRLSLEKTAMENPGDPEAYLILADQAIQQRRVIEAESLYDKGLELTENFKDNARRKRNFEIRARTGRAVVAEQRKNWPAAVADLQALLKIDPDNALAHYRLGRALFMQKKDREGYNEFVTAKKLDKANNIPDAYVAAALTYDQLNMPTQAQKAFDQAMATNKTDANTVTAYAQWLIKSGSIEKAEQALAEARRANPDSINLLILSGVAARMSKKMKPAEDYFIQAWGLSPANIDVINQLALLMIEQSDQAKRDRALQYAGISSQLNSQNADAQVTLSWVLYQLGRTGEADAALRNAVQLGNLSPDSNFLVAKMLVDLNRGDPAKQILKEALETANAGIFINRKEAQALLDTLNK
jgi:tetratricopeptide (TPR) repeat protein